MNDSNFPREPNQPIESVKFFEYVKSNNIENAKEMLNNNPFLVLSFDIV